MVEGQFVVGRVEEFVESHPVRKFLLRLHDFFKERILFQIRQELVPGLELGFHDRRRRSIELYAGLILQPLKILGVLVLAPPVVGRGRRLGRILQNGLVFRLKGVELVLVEDDLEELRRLVVAAQHVHLAHVLGPKAPVGGRVVEFEGRRVPGPERFRRREAG